MFKDKKNVAALQEEIDALDKALAEATNAKNRLELENKELKGDIEKCDKATEDLKKAHAFQEEAYQEDVRRLKEEVEYEQNRPRPGVARLDREGLEVLCNGYFKTECHVEDVCKAYAISGTFGDLIGSDVSLKLMVSKNISCDHLLQPVELLQPRSYQELAEAVGLISLNPTFIFGQLGSKETKGKSVKTAYFRSTPIDAKTTKVLVCIDKISEETMLGLLSYVERHSVFRKDSGGYAFETDKQCIFPIDVLSVLKVIREESFVDGVGLGTPPAIPNWDETQLYKDCRRRWEQHYPHVTFLEEDQ